MRLLKETNASANDMILIRNSFLSHCSHSTFAFCRQSDRGLELLNLPDVDLLNDRDRRNERFSFLRIGFWSSLLSARIWIFSLRPMTIRVGLEVLIFCQKILETSNPSFGRFYCIFYFRTIN